MTIDRSVCFTEHEAFDVLWDGISQLACSPEAKRIEVDRVPNFRDRDSDGEGIPDSEEGARDADGNGIPDYRDPETTR